jgi:hypothetical protein
MAVNTGRKVEPIRLDARRKVEPAGELDLENENDELQAIWAQEQVTAEGTTVDYWAQDLEGSTLDPLYNEPSERLWDGPYRMKVYVEFPAQSFEVREEGNSISWEATMWIPRRTVEDAEMAQEPKEGDVVRIWQIPHFDSFAQGMEDDIPHAGYYFDVIGVMEDGHVFDNPEFTGYLCNIKRRTVFTPERRVFNET